MDTEENKSTAPPDAPELPSWEHVGCDPDTYRLEVPGGYIYRIAPAGRAGQALHVPSTLPVDVGALLAAAQDLLARPAAHVAAPAPAPAPSREAIEAQAARQAAAAGPLAPPPAPAPAPPPASTALALIDDDGPIAAMFSKPGIAAFGVNAGFTPEEQAQFARAFSARVERAIADTHGWVNLKTALGPERVTGRKALYELFRGPVRSTVPGAEPHADPEVVMQLAAQIAGQLGMEVRDGHVRNLNGRGGGRR